MNTITQGIDKLSTLLDKATTFLVFLLLAGMVATTTLQIICRVFFSALSWSEELSRYLLVWTTFLAATMAYRRGNHIAVTFVVEWLPARLAALFSVTAHTLSLAFFTAGIYYGWQVMKLQVFQISPAMAVPMKYVYACIPISLFIMTIHGICSICRQLDKRGGKGDSL